jgi:dinuclear metal center YbgI/SA1388 family protein
MAVQLEELVSYANQLLQHETIQDYPGAKNGLQLGNSGTVSRIAAAVDATERTIRAAVAAKADLLVVHHGIGWQDLLPLTGGNYRKIRCAMDHDLAIYSTHLPLDAHPTLGNNVLLAKALRLKSSRPAFVEKGTAIGRVGTLAISRQGLADRLEKILGSRPHVIDGGSEQIRRIAVITGGAGTHVAEVARSGVDAFITGEGSHWTDGVARELGLNVYYGGHYLTETFGVKALAAHFSRKFKLPWSFLDYPTGL